MVNLDLYRIFYAVARCGSLSKAAKELFVSQPAASLAVKQLESQLGATLFIRTRGGTELTDFGKLVYGDVGEALKLLDGVELKVSELSSKASGTIRIGATDSIFSYVLADKISRFYSDFPEVRLELISSTSPNTISQLKEGKCDIAFVNLPIEDEGVRFCGTVAHITDIFVAGKKYLPLSGEILPVSKLEGLPLIMIEENTVARRELALFCDKLGVKLTPDIELSNWDLLKKLAISGAGAGCIPREYCLEEIESGELFELKISPSLPVRGIGMAVAADSRLSYAMKKFIGLF